MRTSTTYVPRLLASSSLLAGVLLAGITGASRDAWAAAKTWDGGGDGVHWSSKNNWNGNSLPVANDTVTIASSDAVTLDVNTPALTSLTITGGTLTVSGGSTISLTGTAPNSFTVSGGTFTGGTGSITDNGDLNVSATVTNGGDPTLVGYWMFDDASHNVDSSGNGATLGWTGTGTSNFTSDVSPKITFTDSTSVNLTNPTNTYPPSQYAKSSSNLSSLTDLCAPTLTLSAWYRATSTDKNGSEIVSGSNTYGLRIKSTELVVMKRIAVGSTSGDWIEYHVPETGLLDGTWHQIVGVIQTGTGGSMTAYLDGAVVAGSYYINGGTGGLQLLSSSSTPTATAAAASAVDWTDASTTESGPLAIGYNPSGAAGYSFGANSVGGTTSKTCGATNSSTTSLCEIDDVRIYNRALTAAQVAALSGGNQPGGAAGIVSLSGALTVSGNVTVQSTGTLTLLSGSSLSVGSGKTLIVDGTLNASGGTITGAGNYAFTVGSSLNATPTLNISSLAVQKTDANGMNINAVAGAVTTFSELDKIAFTSGTSGTGTALLNISASSLYLSSNGCTFDGSTTYAVKLTSTATSGTGPRLLFGNATCATNDSTTGLCATSEKKDDDANNDGVPSPTTGGVVQFIRAAADDTDGTAVGFPTAGFNWTDFSYYSTYATFHNASSGSDVIYVRDEAGNPLYSWTDPNLIAGTDETIVGTPQWTTSGGKHYLYVGVNGAANNTGGVYRLIDTGTKTTSGTLTLDTTWPSVTKTGYFPCSCTITSDISLDFTNTNVYWAATNASGQRLFGITQAAGVAISGSWPVTAPASVTTSSPTLVTSGTTSLFLGATSTLAELNFSTLAWMQDVPAGIGTITGRVSYGTAFTSGTSRLYVGDASGTVWAVLPGSFATGTVTTFLWKYAAGSAVTDNYYDGASDTVQFGTSGGKVVVLQGAGSGTSGVVLNSSYPYSLPNSDPVSTAPLYYNGVLVVGTAKGNLYFLDRDTGSTTAPSGVAILKEVSFGPTETVSSVGFDANSNRYMVSTSSAANDGRVYYFDLVTDTTSTFQ